MLKSEGLKSVIGMSVGNVGATVVSAIAMIIFSRALGPAQFGIFSVLFSLLLILSRVGDFGINTAVQRYIAQNKGNHTLITRYSRVGVSLKLVLATLLAIIGLVFGKTITVSLLHLNSDATLPVQLVFILSLGVIFYEYINALLQGVQLFQLSIISNWIQSGTKLFVALASFFYQSLSLLTITLLYLLAPILGGFIGFSGIKFQHLIPLWDSHVVTKILSVSRWTGIAILAATIADNFDILIVQNQLSSYDTGLYSAAVRIASVASLAAYSLGTVLNVRVASYHDRTHLHSYLKKAVSLSLLSLVGLSLLSLISHPAITLTVGAEYTPAIPALNLLFVSTAILTATSPFVALFYLFDHPEYFAISGIISTVFLLGSDWLLIPQYGLMGAAYARIIARLMVLLFTLAFAKFAYHEKYGH